MHCGALSPSPDVEETVHGLDVKKTCAPTHTHARTSTAKHDRQQQQVLHGLSNMLEFTDKQTKPGMLTRRQDDEQAQTADAEPDNLAATGHTLVGDGSLFAMQGTTTHNHTHAKENS